MSSLADELGQRREHAEDQPTARGGDVRRLVRGPDTASPAGRTGNGGAGVVRHPGKDRFETVLDLVTTIYGRYIGQRQNLVNYYLAGVAFRSVAYVAALGNHWPVALVVAPTWFRSFGRRHRRRPTTRAFRRPAG